jgi:hypothetical protein
LAFSDLVPSVSEDQVRLQRLVGRRPGQLKTTAAPFCSSQVTVEREGVPIQVVESEFARSPRGIANAIDSALDAALAVFCEERVWILHGRSRTKGTQLVS